MVKKNNSKEKATKDFTINFEVPIKHHVFTLKSAKKWLEQNIKVKNLDNNDLEDKLKLSISDKTTLIISIDNTINFTKRHIISLVKNFLKIKKAKYYRISPISPNDFSIIAVK